MKLRTLAPWLAALGSAGCGGTVASADASVASDAATDPDVGPDVAPDGKKPCLSNGEPSTSAVKCCSFSTRNDVCVATCWTHGSGCNPPDRPCCADAGSCVNGTCQ